MEEPHTCARCDQPILGPGVLSSGRAVHVPWCPAGPDTVKAKLAKDERILNSKGHTIARARGESEAQEETGEALP